jgi:hypothetical protein
MYNMQEPFESKCKWIDRYAVLYKVYVFYVDCKSKMAAMEGQYFA